MYLFTESEASLTLGKRPVTERLPLALFSLFIFQSFSGTGWP